MSLVSCPSPKPTSTKASRSPTDPILASSVVKGSFSERHVPPYVRYLLLAESGINDGAATPYFLLPLTILTTSTAKEAAHKYLLEGLLFELAFAIAVGCTTGWVFRKSLEYGKKWELVDKESALVYTVSLAVLVIGAVSPSSASLTAKLIPRPDHPHRLK